MDITRFESICKNAFGKSFQNQVADYLMISRKTISSWLERGSVPKWVDAEIQSLIQRRAKEAQFAKDAINMSDDEFYHHRAVLFGEAHHYDCKKYKLEDIKEFIQNQGYRVLQEAKLQKKNGGSLEDIIEFIEADFLSENDIADHLERNETAQVDIEQIREIRGDACFDAKQAIQDIF